MIFVNTETKFSFEWILNHFKKGEDIYQKAKLRHAVLDFESPGVNPLLAVPVQLSRTCFHVLVR